MFASVKEGFIYRHLTFGPLADITLCADSVSVDATKGQVQGAPTMGQNSGDLT